MSRRGFWRRGLIALTAALAGTGCDKALLPPAAPQLDVRPFLHRPFAGDYAVTSVFDHDLPLSWDDTNGAVLAWWGDTIEALDGHQGYDWPMPDGTPLLAAASGFVTRAGIGSEQYCPPLGRSTRNVAVVILHPTPEGERFVLLYSHLSEVAVEIGDVVAPGDVVGYSGDTGCSTGPHLHFQVEYQGPWDGRTVPGALPVTGEGGVPVDPYGWAGSGADPWALRPFGAVSRSLWVPGAAPEVGPPAAGHSVRGGCAARCARRRSGRPSCA